LIQPGSQTENKVAQNTGRRKHNMARDPRRTIRRKIEPDVRYKSVLISKFINKMMVAGKKSIAEKLFYDAMDIIEQKTKKAPNEIFDEALRNVCPTVQVKSRRIGGSNYQIPVEVKGDRKYHYGMIWIRDAARARKGKPYAECLAEELIDAANGAGNAVKKREDTHKMAEANKAFAHFARY
jgi:small subunit ribosomal protein S7